MVERGVGDDRCAVFRLGSNSASYWKASFPWQPAHVLRRKSGETLAIQSPKAVVRQQNLLGFEIGELLKHWIAAGIVVPPGPQLSLFPPGARGAHSTGGR